MEIPVAAGDILVAIGVECFYRWLEVPYLFEEIHVLILQVGLLLFLAEVFGGGFGFAEGGGETLDLFLVEFEGV